MRSFRKAFLAEMIVAGVLLAVACLIVDPAHADSATRGSDWATEVSPASGTPMPESPGEEFSALRSKLDPLDRVAALEALQFALDEVGDGATYVWRRKQGTLGGQVRPTSSFRDTAGKICRHVVFALSLGTVTRQVESIACRATDRRWLVEG
jgi:hypothetical protein